MGMFFQMMLIVSTIVALSAHRAEAQVVAGQSYQLFTACGAQEKVMGINGQSLSDSATTVLQTRNDSNRAQIFKFETAGTVFKLRASHSGKVLGILQASKTSGASLVQQTDANLSHQQFRVSSTTDGFIRLQNVLSGLYVDLSGANTADGTKFIQYSSNSSCAQKFKMRLMTAPTTTTTTVPQVSWIRCATEGGTCTFTGTRQVRYGANGIYAYRTATGSIACNNETFGDPVYGATKYCDYSSSTQSPTTTTVPTTTTTLIPVTTTTTLPVPPSSGTLLPTPSNIANGSVVQLQCGVIYQGTLNLAGKSSVTVKTVGTCGKASLTPGRVVSSWTRESGNIYSAPISFTPVQVSVAGSPVGKAHWPNQAWANPGAATPNSDLTGATLVSMQNKWTIRNQTLSANTNTPSGSYPYFVEGKLWMLDSANEWAVSGGRLYVWAADGLSPEGRTWASAQSDYVAASSVSSGITDLASLGINANNSSGIIIDGVKIFGASDAISAGGSTNLQILNTDVSNSSRDGIFASGSRGLVIRNSTFSNSGRNGIGGWYSNDAIVSGNTVSTSGIVALMPRPSQGGIFFGYTSTNVLIENNKVYNSGYNGITAHINSTIKNNIVDGACSTLADGGGIYTNGRTSGVALNLRIEGNTVSNVYLDGSKGIYLDDDSSFVTVSGNTVSNSRTGLFIHDGHDNTIVSNLFRSNINHHLAMATTASNNRVTNNTFQSTRGELTYALEGSSNVTTFGIFDYNTYSSSDVNRFASAAGTKSYSAWKTYMKQDSHSTMNGLP